MGRGRKKAGAGAVEAARYDVFGNVVGERTNPPLRVANTDESGRKYGRNQYRAPQYTNDNLPEGWQPIRDGDVTKGIKFTSTDPVTGEERVVQLRPFPLGGDGGTGSIMVDVNKNLTSFAAEDVNDYILNPDARPQDRVIDFGRLAWDVTQGLRALDSRRQNRAALLGTDAERTEVQNQFMDAIGTPESRANRDAYEARLSDPFASPDLPPRNGLNDRNYELRLQSANVGRVTFPNFTGKLKTLTNGELFDLEKAADRRMREISDSIASLRTVTNANLRRQMRDALYRRAAQVIDLGSQARAERRQRVVIGEYDVNDGKFQSLASYKNDARTAYSTVFEYEVERALSMQVGSNATGGRSGAYTADARIRRDLMTAPSIDFD